MTQVLLMEPPTPDNPHGVMRILASIGQLKANITLPPYDHMILSGFLNKHGISNRIYDGLALKVSWDDVRRVIKKEDPEVVCFTDTIPTFKNDATTARIAHETNPDIKTIAMNMAHEFTKINLMERYPDVDFLPYRDYNYPILKLIQGHYDGSKVKGIYWRDDGKVRKNVGGHLTKNIDDLGVPNQYGIKDYLHLYHDEIIYNTPMSIVACAEGCINKCAHCVGAHSLNPLRVRSLDGIMEELRMAEEMGVREIRWWDGELPFSEKWGEEFFTRIKREGFDLVHSSNTRADCITRRTLRLARDARWHTFLMGADSSSQTVLDNMHKNETVEQIEQAARLIKEWDFRLFTYCTLGHKGETQDTMRSTIKWLRDELKPEFSTFSLVVPIVGTVFYKYLEKHGYLRMTEEGEDWDAGKPPVYDYIGRMEMEGLSDMTSEEMYQIAQWGYRYFYLRPSLMWRRLRSNWRNLPWDVRNFLYFISMYVKTPFLRKLKSREMR